MKPTPIIMTSSRVVLSTESDAQQNWDDEQKVTSIDEDHQQFVTKMILKAVTDLDIGKVKDIFNRYQFDQNIQDVWGNSLISIAALKSDAKLIEYLCQRGVDTNTKNKDGNTPMHFACGDMCYNSVDILIKFGAKENIKNHNGLTCWEISSKYA